MKKETRKKLNEVLEKIEAAKDYVELKTVLEPYAAYGPELLRWLEYEDLEITEAFAALIEKWAWSGYTFPNNDSTRIAVSNLIEELVFYEFYELEDAGEYEEIEEVTMELYNYAKFRFYCFGSYVADSCDASNVEDMKLFANQTALTN